MEKKSKKCIIISAVNVVDAGPFAVLKDCLAYLSENLSTSYNIVALVHNKALFGIDNITYYEFPDSKKSWLNRLYYEYIYFKKLSEELKPYLWLSLHDTTPNVRAGIQAVYCHHASPFYKLSLKDFVMDPKFAIFHFFYPYIYRFNIRKNNFVIVQHDWMRKIFKRRFGLDNVIVSYLDIRVDRTFTKREENKEEKFKFFYPSLPRVFKNFEAVCEAAKVLSEKRSGDFEIYVTIDGTENNYSRYIYDKYKDVKEVRFIGFQERDKVFEYYDMADCMVFPSKLESWGLPITEFKNFKKPIFLSDLEYAYETIGDYDKVKFFNPDNPVQLAALMNDIIGNRLVFDKVKSRDINPPFALNWQQLFDILLKR